MFGLFLKLLWRMFEWPEYPATELILLPGAAAEAVSELCAAKGGTITAKARFHKWAQMVPATVNMATCATVQATAEHQNHLAAARSSLAG